MLQRSAHTRLAPGLVFALVALLLAGSAWAAAPHSHALNEGRDYDARTEITDRPLVQKSIQQENALEVLKAQVGDLAVTFDAQFGTTRTLSSHTGYLSMPNKAAGEPMAVAMEFVNANLEALGLSAADLAEYEVTDTVYSKVSGSTHIYLRQMFRGLPLFNAQLQINVNRDGRIISVNNAFVKNLPVAVKRSTASISAAEAVASAALSIDSKLAVMPKALSEGDGIRQSTRFDGNGLSLQAIDAELMYLPISAGDVRLVWNFQIDTLDTHHMYNFTVDAETGQVWTRFDYVKSDSFRVYEQPVESPIHTSPLPPNDARTLVVNPEDATASPNDWFSGTGIMDGNNVHACADVNANNVCDSPQPTCSGGTCDFTINLNAQPGASQGAAITNLFYWNNIIHDIQYQYGFDEAGGNFQENNFGRGGAGSDSVNADAQDTAFPSPCNANFGTPSDGGNPRMQMFLCDNTNPDRDGDYDNIVIVHEYGHGISTRQVGGPGNSGCLNNNQQPGEGWSDLLGLIYTANASEVSTKARGVGAYLFGLAANGGTIRDLPYSTSNAVNNHTYSSIAGAAIPHGIGSRWAQAGWEVYWALVDKWGFEGDLVNFNINDANEAGNKRALFYINQGLKNTACSPTFINARDGIIQAATDNFAGADVCDIWQAFADFGLGVNASTGGSNSTTATNGFNIPASCDDPPPPSDCPAGSIDLTTMVSYSNQNASNGMSNPDNETITLTGNTWKRTTQTFNITADTMVEFTFSSTDQGEIHAIGFDPDDTLNNQAAHCQFWGTQNWTGTGNIGNGTCGATYSGSGTQSFTYPIGQFITGNRFLVLTNDDDAQASANGTFSCVRVFEDGGPPPGGCTVDDDFEANTDNWTISGASTCTTGTYVDGNPTQQTSTVVTQPAGSASGVHSIFTATNTSAGNADVDGGNCIVETINPYAVGVPSTLSISYFHGQRDTGDDPGDDFFNVQWSSNGGASWNNVVSNGDTRSVASWSTATAQVPAGNIDVRVQCSDGAGPGDIVECGIDDLSICDN